MKGKKKKSKTERNRKETISEIEIEIPHPFDLIEITAKVFFRARKEGKALYLKILKVFESISVKLRKRFF